MSATVEFGIPSDPSHPLTHTPTEDESRRIREHLEVLLTDPLFSNSKRLPGFLRYVVSEALAGHSEGQIKERSIGVVVFGRTPDYDTNADPVVRMTAGEVRKKLAQYYYANHHADIQIEIPLGSYMPRFRSQSEASPPGPPTEHAPATPILSAVTTTPPSVAENVPRSPRLWLPWSIAVFALIAAASSLTLRYPVRLTSVDRFWNSFTAPSKDVIIVLPALERVPQALPSYHFEAESVAMEDAEVATRVSNELNQRKFSSHFIFSTAVSLSDLRSNPFVLIGAMDNVWTMRLSQSLPFAFERSDDRRYGRIVDRKNANISWTEDFSVPNANISQDYGIIARFTDPTTEQPTVLIAGISAEGTLAAGEAVTTPRYLDMLLKAAGNSPNSFEAVIETRVIDGRSGPPTIVAMRTW